MTKSTAEDLGINQEVVSLRSTNQQQEPQPTRLGFERHRCPSCGFYGGAHKYNCPNK